jgi:hypothetical protein
MADEIEIVPSPRPETKEAEDAYFLRVYREALTEISDIIELPGSPSLTTDVVEGVRKLAMENARLRGER